MAFISGSGTISGGPAADTIYGDYTDDTLFGGDGNDRLDGLGGADTLLGETGDDSLNLSTFDDLVTDTLADGGSGIDTVSLNWYSVKAPVILNLTDTSVDHVVGTTIIRNVERLYFYGGLGDDVVTGGALADNLYGGGGHNTLNGGGGDDYLGTSYNGIDELDGGDGIDTASVAAYGLTSPITFSIADPSLTQSIGNATIRNIERIDFTGGDGDDNVTGGALDDHLNGGLGINVLHGGGGDDIFTDYAGGTGTFDGGDGIDGAVIYTSSTVDFILGDGTIESHVGNIALQSVERIEIYAYGSNNNVTGGQLDDVVHTSYGFNRIDGGAGDDLISLVSRHADVEGGDGIDTLEIIRGGGGAGVDFTLGDPSVITSAGALHVHGVEKLIFIGGVGDDKIIGGAWSDMLNGGHGDDMLSGASGDDTLFGDFGDDTLMGGDGNDSLEGWVGKDSLFGGDGDDSINSYGGIDTVIDGGAGTDFAKIERTYSSDGNVALDISDPSADQHVGATIVRGIERLDYSGGYGKDVITGGSLDDNLRGGYGDDILVGGGGNDVLDGGPGADTVSGGEGDDIVIYSADSPPYFGPPLLTDTMVDGGTGVDMAAIEVGKLRSGVTFDLGQPGDHLIGTTVFRSIEQINIEGTSKGDNFTGAGLSDTLDGRNGDDVLDGAGGDDVLVGGNGDDLVSGGQGSDQITGGNGDDSLKGGAGDDNLSGGGGRDTLEGGAGNDLIFGGPGTDTLVLSGAHGDYLFELQGDHVVITDQRSGGSGDGIDQVYGVELTRFADGTFETRDALVGFTGAPGNSITGGDASPDILRGTEFADLIRGLGGNDHLMGLDGDDVLVGGAGKDVLTGGAGADRFVFEPGSSGVGGANRDVITDFQSGIDHIDLTAFGPQMTYSTVVVGSDLYLRIDIDGNTRMDMQINIHTDGGLLTAGDFIF